MCLSLTVAFWLNSDMYTGAGSCHGHMHMLRLQCTAVTCSPETLANSWPSVQRMQMGVVPVGIMSVELNELVPLTWEKRHHGAHPAPYSEGALCMRERAPAGPRAGPWSESQATPEKHAA